MEMIGQKIFCMIRPNSCIGIHRQYPPVKATRNHSESFSETCPEIRRVPLFFQSLFPGGSSSCSFVKRASAFDKIKAGNRADSSLGNWREYRLFLAISKHSLDYSKSVSYFQRRIKTSNRTNCCLRKKEYNTAITCL